MHYKFTNPPTEKNKQNKGDLYNNMGIDVFISSLILLTTKNKNHFSIPLVLYPY